MLAELQETATNFGVAGGGGYAVLRFLEWIICRARRNGNGQTERPGQAEMCIRHEAELAAGKERFNHVLESLKSLHEKVDKLK